MGRSKSQQTAPLWCVLAILWCSAAAPLSAWSADDTEDSTVPAEAAEHFRSQVAPLLTRHCSECHGATSKKGRLDLSHKEVAFVGGDSGPSIVPGKAAESLLWELVDSDEMPENRPPLSSDEKEILRQWIEDGATWPDGATVGGSSDNDVIASNWLRRLTVPEYIETVRSSVGVDVERDARGLLPRDLRADGFSNTAYNLNVDLAHVEAYAKLAEIIVERMDVAAFAAEHGPCQELSHDCMPQTISGIGKWLLRGPLEEHELAAFVRVSKAVADEGGDAQEAVAYVIEAMLQSPRFLYRIEKQRGDPGEQRVGDYELASRISYILWGGPPDKELMRAADAGALADRVEVEKQVRRMLEDPRTIDRSSRFISEWLNLEQLDYLRPNPDRFPNWNAALAADMREETLAFWKEIVWEQNRPLWDLMNAQVTFATPRLAEHYGLDPSSGVAVQETPVLARTTERTEPRSAGHAANGLQALYLFDEGSGDVVRDTSGAGKPLDLKIEKTGATKWSHGGLTIDGSTRIATASPPKRLIDAFKKSKAITLEAWITPANTSQKGPARIATLSANTGVRNFTLGQDGDHFEVRLRTATTTGNGEPSLSSPAGTVETAETHVVYTRDKSGDAVIYINGREAERRRVEGDFANWDNGFQFAVANELSKDRPWKGTLHRIAVYDRALSADVVRHHHADGAEDETNLVLAHSKSSNARVTDDLQAFYRFDEGSGDVVRDTSGAGKPLDLKIEDPGAVTWDGDGLKVNGSTRIATAKPAKRMIDAIKKSKAVTLEAWVTPANASQDGPARIATLSVNSSARNFTLGQEGNEYDVRLRTTKTDRNGMPGLSSSGNAVRTRPTHVVYTRDAPGKARLYVDGEQVSSRDVGGDFSNWESDFRFAVANELSNDRPWRGTLHAVAVYSRALSAEEVSRNKDAGAREDGAPALARSQSTGAPGDPALQALYQFDEGIGQTVRDMSGAGEPLDLRIDNPSAVSWSEKGLTVNQSTRILSDGPPKRLFTAIQASNAVTLEAWITPANDSQDGPARIVTLSSGISQRNFTLGQDGDQYDARLRATQTDGNGMPSLSSPVGKAVTQPTHVVYTRDSGAQARLFVDGVEVARRYVQGDLSNWDASFSLGLANESSGDRPWLGTLHRVAIYSRALTPQEVLSKSRINTPLKRFDLASTHGRGGLLTQGSVLTIGGDDASMVTRGLFVLKDVLYDQVGDPPPCLDTSPVPAKPGLSRREIALQRVESASCGGCHSRFEPLAFGLEKFDGLGSYQEKDEHGNELREDGEIAFPDREEPVSYDTSAEMMDLLAGSDRVRKNFTRKVIQFALGRPLVNSDSAIVDEIHKSAQEGGGTYASLITSIVMSDLVQMTSMETEQ